MQARTRCGMRLPRIRGYDMKPFFIRAMMAGAFALSAPGFAQAGPFSAFETQLRSVYSIYRQALFTTNQKNAEGSAKTAAALEAGWARLAQDWRVAPPQYADDPQFAATLARIGGIIAGARAQIAGGALGEAHEGLEKIRDDLRALRARNNMRSFSDVIDEYHHIMEETQAQARLEQGPAALLALRDRAALLVYLADKIAAAPPPEGVGRPEFAAMAQGVRQSAEALRAATAVADPVAIKAALGGLKKPFAALFVNFG